MASKYKLAIRKDSAQGEDLISKEILILPTCTYSIWQYNSAIGQGQVPGTKSSSESAPKDNLLHTKNKRCQGDFNIMKFSPATLSQESVLTLHTATEKESGGYNEKGKLIPFNIWVGFVQCSGAGFDDGNYLDWKSLQSASMGSRYLYNASKITDTKVGQGAFNSCEKITSIDIPDGVDVEMNTFQSCSNLTRVKLPADITSIGNSTFRECSSLTQITISENVSYIGQMAFSGCSSLRHVTIPKKVITIDQLAFSGCVKLTSITFTGTKAEWDKIQKIPSWNYNTGSYTIHCTDGDITK